MEIFFFLSFLFIIFVAVGVGVSYLVHQDRETKMRQWQSFAAAKRLTFTPGRWNLFDPISASVSGEYHDCHVVLTTVQRSQGKSSVTYTQLSVRPQQQLLPHIPLDKYPLGQPLAYHDLRSLLSQPDGFYRSGSFQLKIEDRGQRICYEERDIVADHNILERILNFLTDLAYRYPTVMVLGGEAVPALQEIASESSDELKPVAQQLLHDIADDTSYRLRRESDQRICPTCLTSCASYDLRLHWWSFSITFYGCRVCRQSRHFLKGPLTAVLDSQMKGELVDQQKGIRVNWLYRHQLFDFSRVEIIEASDEEVERFAVQVGNDTDEWRTPHYHQMPCVVSDQCHLSENTLRILERMFGEVRAKV